MIVKSPIVSVIGLLDELKLEVGPIVNSDIWKRGSPHLDEKRGNFLKMGCLGDFNGGKRKENLM